MAIFLAACKSLLRVFEDIPQSIEKDNRNFDEICILPTNEEPISTESHKTTYNNI